MVRRAISATGSSCGPRIPQLTHSTRIASDDDQQVTDAPESSFEYKTPRTEALVVPLQEPESPKIPSSLLSEDTLCYLGFTRRAAGAIWREFTTLHPLKEDVDEIRGGELLMNFVISKIDRRGPLNEHTLSEQSPWLIDPETREVVFVQQSMLNEDGSRAHFGSISYNLKLRFKMLLTHRAIAWRREKAMAASLTDRGRQ